jgi:hypothetical protein
VTRWVAICCASTLLSGCGRYGYEIGPDIVTLSACRNGAFTVLQRATVDYGGAADLSDYPVAVLLDMTTWVDPGPLLATCDNLAVIDAVEGAQLDHYLAPSECGTSSAQLWIALPLLTAGSAPSLAIGACDGARPGDPASVFEFFDGFDTAHDWSLAPDSWVRRGDAPLEQLGDGVLRLPGGTTPHAIAIETSLAWVEAGSTALGVRFRGQGGQSDDFEVGAGSLSQGLWHRDRRGFWATFLTWDKYLMTFGNGAQCHETPDAPPTYQVADEWYVTEVFYTIDDETRLEADVLGPSGVSMAASTSGCGPLPGALPGLIVFDHSDSGDDPSTEIDRVYVRQKVADEPVVHLAGP